MNIMAMSLESARKSDELMGHLTKLRHEKGWFRHIHEKGAGTVLVLIACEYGRPVGALHADELKIGIFVEPQRRRNGIGTRLMEEAFKRIGKHMACVLDDEVSTKFFLTQRKDMKLQLVHGLNLNYTMSDELWAATLRYSASL